MADNTNNICPYNIRDFSTQVQEQGGEAMCRIDDHGYEGQIADDQGVLQSGPFEGEQVDVCENSAMSQAYFAAVDRQVEFVREDLTNLRRMYDGDPDSPPLEGTYSVVLNAKAHPGRICLNIADPIQARHVFEQLDESDCEGVFTGDDDTVEKKCDMVLGAVQENYNSHFPHSEPLEMNEDRALRYAGYAGGAVGVLASGGLTFGVAVPWLQKWFGPRGGGHGGGNALTGSGQGPSAAAESGSSTAAAARSMLSWFAAAGSAIAGAAAATGEFIADHAVEIGGAVLVGVAAVAAVTTAPVWVPAAAVAGGAALMIGGSGFDSGSSSGGETI